MILVGLCTPLFLLVTSIIAILPNSAFESGTVTGFVSMFATAFQFFPADVWILCLGSITFWISIHAIFGIINFVLKLIPIINVGR